MKRRYAMILAVVSIFSAFLPYQTFAQSDETIRMALELVREKVENCQRSRPECGSGPLPSWADFTWVQEEHKVILYRGGCLDDAHSHWNFRGPDRANSGRKAYLEMVAIAAAKGALGCGTCPPESYWNSDEGRNLASRLAKTTAESGGWYDFKQRCRPDRNAQARPSDSGPATTTSSEAARCEGNGLANCRITWGRPDGDFGDLYVQHHLARAGCVDLAREARKRSLSDYYDVVRAAIIKNDSSCVDFTCPTDPEERFVHDFWESRDWREISTRPDRNPVGGNSVYRPDRRIPDPEIIEIVERRCNYAPPQR